MKKIGIKEGNEIIAGFMGWININTVRPEFKLGRDIWQMHKNYLPIIIERIKSPLDKNYDAVERLNFDKSWDWLMPVVEKIAEMKYPINIYISHAQKTAYVHDLDEKHYVIRESSTIQSPIETTFRAVVDFIKIHNKTNTNNQLK